MALTKYAVAEKIQSEMEFTKSDSRKTVESLLEIIKSTMESGEDVLIHPRVQPSRLTQSERSKTSKPSKSCSMTNQGICVYSPLASIPI